MKVIKEGEWNLPWSAEMGCPTCEAVLLIEEKDVKPVDYDYGYHCACVICGKSISIPEKLLPLRIKEACEKKRKYRSSGGYWD